MKKFTNFLAGACAAGACALMMYLSYEAGRASLILNGIFLVVMVALVIAGTTFGVMRLLGAAESMDLAAGDVTGGRIDPTDPNATPFGIDVLDAKHAKYAKYAASTNGAGDLSEFLTEDDVESYANGKIPDAIPDVLTSLGILGTFVGLVWGMRGFNPATYEAMAQSMESLTDGIKVAFTTSIMGISLSLAFTLWLRRAQAAARDSYARTMETFRAATAPSKADREAERIADGQERQAETMETLMKELPNATAEAVAQKLEPVTKDMSETLERFIDVVTLNQQELVETVAKAVTDAMVREFAVEFKGMRRTLEETNVAQRENVRTMNAAHDRYEISLAESSKRIEAASKAEATRMREASAETKKQRESLTKLVEAVSQLAERMGETAYEDLNARMAMAKQVETCQRLSTEMEESVIHMRKESGEFMKSVAEAKATATKVEMPEVKELSEKLDALMAMLSEDKKTRKSLFG